jgi:hypothetical protein
VKLSADGTLRGTGQVPGLLTSQPQEGLQVGCDLGARVGTYRTEFPLTGTIRPVQALACGCRPPNTRHRMTAPRSKVRIGPRVYRLEPVIESSTPVTVPVQAAAEIPSKVLARG